MGPYLGHAAALVTHAEEEREQQIPGFAPHPPPVAAKHRLQEEPEQADGELPEPAASLEARRKRGDVGQILMGCKALEPSPCKLQITAGGPCSPYSIQEEAEVPQQPHGNGAGFLPR